MVCLNNDSRLRHILTLQHFSLHARLAILWDLICFTCKRISLSFALKSLSEGTPSCEGANTNFSFRSYSRPRNSHDFAAQIGHFRVPPCLCIKTRLSAQPLICKHFFIIMQIKLIFTRKVVHLASFWKWLSLVLGSGLFLSLTDFWAKERLVAV